MKADNKVTKVSLSSVPAVAIFEREPGINVTVFYVLVRTEYEETEEEAIKRASRVAQRLTTMLGRSDQERR